MATSSSALLLQNPASLLDPHLPAALRLLIEARYWAPIGEAAMVERFIDDPALHAAPDRHPALFSDHGVVHVRDIAASAAELAMRLNGRLIAGRPDAQQAFVQGVAVLLAYFHDIGMVEPSAAGRRVHPQFAAQTVLGADFDALAGELWQADAGGLRSRLQALAQQARLPLPPAQIAREVMALSLCHSKSAVPAAALDDRPRLRRLMRRACLTDLQAQREGRLSEQDPDRRAPSAIVQRYAAAGLDADALAFAWLVDDGQPAPADFTGEVIDAVRILRAADALRQRGTTLRTSAGYEVCTDRSTGEAVVGLRTADQRHALLLRFHNPISAAEANIRATSINNEGALVVEFYRGHFAQAGARESLLAVSSDVIADIEADALASFSQPAAPPPEQRLIHLVAPADDPQFATDLAVLAAARHPGLAGRLRTSLGSGDADVHTLPGAPPAWAEQGEQPAPDHARQAEIFQQMQAHGLNVAAIDSSAAWAGTRLVRVPQGTVLIEPGSWAHFVIVPLTPGLLLQPLGGYAAHGLQPWIPLGVTGVVRGGERNAGVLAQQDVELLYIEAEHYLSAWFKPYGLAALRQWLAALRGRPA